MAKVKIRTPSGRVVIKIKRRRPSFAKCAYCGKPLHGIPKLTPAETRKISKTKRRPERPYGGYLCPECSRELFRERARKIS
jgi:large subunit ribosomal protein L34e